VSVNNPHITSYVVCCVQAMEAEASYKACIQAANSAREQLDLVKVDLQKLQSVIDSTNFCVRLVMLVFVC